MKILNWLREIFNPRTATKPTPNPTPKAATPMPTQATKNPLSESPAPIRTTAPEPTIQPRKAQRVGMVIIDENAPEATFAGFVGGKPGLIRRQMSATVTPEVSGRDPACPKCGETKALNLAQ